MIMYKTKEQKREFYNSRHWKAMSLAVKKRDNYECQECKRQGYVKIDTYEIKDNGRKKIILVADHIKELEDYPELALDPDNLETLCVSCHNKKHGRYFIFNFKKKKTKWDDERW
ncbi:HNH endonuclease [Virgibacillus kimchii]